MHGENKPTYFGKTKTVGSLLTGLLNTFRRH